MSTAASPAPRRWVDVPAFAAMGLGQTAIAIVRVTASYKALDLGASALGVGIVGGAFAALSLVAALPLGIAIDRFGERRFLLMGMVLLAAAPVLELVAGSLWLLIVGQAVLGLGQTSQAVSIQTHTANNKLSRFSVDERFARVSMVASSGQLAGPAISGLALGTAGPDASTTGTLVAYLIAVGCALTGLAAAMFVRSTPRATGFRPTIPGRKSVLAMLRNRELRTALLASMLVLTTLDILIAYLPVLGEERDISPAMIGLMLSLQSAAGLTFRVFLPRLLRLLGRKRVLAVMLLLSGVSMLGIGFAWAPWLLIVLVILLGFGLGGGQPLTMSWTAESASLDARGSALAVRVAANRLGQLIVPAIVGSLAVALGAGAAFGAGAVGLLLGSAWLHRSGRS